MLILLLGLGLFIVPHLFRETGARDRLISRLGPSGYKGFYSLMSLAGLALIIYGKSRAPFVQLWEPVFEYRWLSLALMIPSLTLVAAGNLPDSALKTRIGHPLLVGVLLWALAHLWANGDLASVLLFASLGFWATLKALTLPRANAVAANRWDPASLGIGLVAYALLVIFHGSLFGVGLSL